MSYSGPLAGSLAAKGRLVSPNGRAIEGAKVVLYAWPVTSVVSKIRHGQRVPLKIVGSAITSASGRYAIRVTSPAALSSSAERDGIVNLEIITTTRAGWDAYSFPRRLVPTAHGAVLAIASDGTAARVAPQVANLHLMRANHHLMPAVAGRRGPRVCGDLSPVKNFGPQRSTVGATYSHVTGVKMNFTYGNGQRSSLGVGVSSSGSFGTWSASGTHDQSSTSSESFPTFTGATSNYYRTEFVYEEYLVECDGFQTQAKSFAGGATTAGTGPPSAAFCVIQAAGSTFHKSTSSAHTFSTGVSISSTIGVNLSAHTGYNTTAELTYAFTQRHDLCGSNDYPGGTPERLVAGLG